MKRKICLFITGVIIAGSLAGCGGNSNSSYKSEPSYFAEEASPAYASDDMYYDAEYADYAEAAVESANNGIESVDDSAVDNTNRKIIRTVNIDAETEEFDSFIANVESKVSALGGYLESTNISGRSINSSKSNMRNANLTARIPSKNLDSFVTNVAETSNITNKSESADDVTLSYADTEAHIKSLRTEQERLDELLLQADDIETIIAIESRITDVRYELESYESRLRTMDNKVDYSTVYINVREVERYTPVEVPEETVWQRISVGFTENLIDAWDVLVDFFVGFIIAIPKIIVLLIFLAIPVIIILLIVRAILIASNGPEYRDELKKKRMQRKENRIAYKKKMAEAKKANAEKKRAAKTNGGNGNKPTSETNDSKADENMSEVLGSDNAIDDNSEK